ncbi:MAG: flavodoxin family protein [Methanomassiliicoccaceae archaeon]|nr:flavodoxin family protein [Methanomassiliicoccaceae archaeon]
MRILIINGSPRADGNTSELVKRFIGVVGGRAETEEARIFDMDIRGCRNFGACQRAVLDVHCAVGDDMAGLYDRFLSCDATVIASPIYMWQFTPCTMAFLSRLHCLCRSEDFSYNAMAGRRVAALVTSGAEESVADYAMNGLRDFCEFFSVRYEGDARAPFATKDGISSGEHDGSLRALAERILG